MKEKKSKGRPSTVTLCVEKRELEMANRNIREILKTKVKCYSKSGCYIPLSGKYENHDAFVIVLEKNKK